MIGGVVAGLVGVQGTPPATADDASVAEALMASENAAFAEEAELMPQMSITEAQAEQRLAEVAASRAARAERAATEAAAAEAAAAEAARPRTVAPVENARMTTCFCMRWGTFHRGIDLAAPMLTPEYSVEDGVVLRAGAVSGYGQAVYILGESGDVTIYGHMEEIEVSAGDVVEAGQQIALLGSRGQSTGPHLHFEIHSGGLNGEAVDPVEWLAERGVDL